MKKILLTLLIVFITTFSFSQTEYPTIKTDETGKRVITLTIGQANILASNSELLEIYQKYFEQRNEIDGVILKLIDNQNKIINKQDILIYELKQYSKNKDDRINILIEQIKLYEQVPSVEKVYITDEKESKKLKISKMVSGGLLIAVLILLL